MAKVSIYRTIISIISILIRTVMPSACCLVPNFVAKVSIYLFLPKCRLGLGLTLPISALEFFFNVRDILALRELLLVYSHPLSPCFDVEEEVYTSHLEHCTLARYRGKGLKRLHTMSWIPKYIGEHKQPTALHPSSNTSQILCNSSNHKHSSPSDSDVFPYCSVNRPGL